MKAVVTLIVGALVLACATLAQAGTPIVPKAAAVVTDHDFGSPYSISDDQKGLQSGSQFLRLKGVPSRRGWRFGGDSHDVHMADIDLALKAPQTGSALPAMIEIVGTNHDFLIERVTGRNSFMVCDPSHYCNGDIFSTEAGVYRTIFRDTKAISATDACYDLKGHPRLENAYAEDCNRLLRVWHGVTGSTVTLVNPHHRGGTGGAAVVWMEHNARLDLDKLVVRATAPGTLFDCDGGTNCVITLGAYDFDLPAGMRIAKGVTVNWGPQGAPDLTKPVKTAPPPPPAAVAAPAPVAPVYDYTSQSPIPDSNHDSLVTVATDPALLKLFPKGTVLKLIASDADGFHYVRQPKP